MKVMKKITDSFWTSFGILSRFPGKKNYTPDFSMFGFFLPMFGFIVSFINMAVFLLVSTFLARNINRIAVIIIIQYAMFNIFHFDGLLDSADALLFNTTPGKRLEILKDRQAGSFAIFAGILYMFLKLQYLLFGLKIAFPHSSLAMTAILFLYPLSGRISAGIIPLFLSPAKKDGLGALLSNYRFAPYMFGCTISFLFPLAIIFIWSGSLFWLIPFSGAFVSGFIVIILFGKLIGGFTGDALGLAIELGELFHIGIFIEIAGRGLF